MIASYFRDLGRSAWNAWDRFFFTPADPTPLALIRIFSGALLVWNLGVLSIDLKDYLGNDGWIGSEAVIEYMAEHQPWAWSLWLWIPESLIIPLWTACIVVAVLLTIGYKSRLTAVLSWMIAVSTVRRMPVALFGFDQILSTWLFYLALSGASGQALSLDRFLHLGRLKGKRGAQDCQHPPSSVAANIGLRLIQLHLVVIYASAGLSKLQGPEWWDGRAMEMIMLTPEFRRFDLVWLAAYPTCLNLATHTGLLIELSYPVLIWVRKLRPLVLVAALLLHVGIDVLLGLTEFGIAMIAANLAFVPGAVFRDAGSKPANTGAREDRASFRPSFERKSRIQAR